MRGRTVGIVVGVLLGAGSFACWSGAPLIWDGAYQLSLSLICDKPFAYLSRFHSAILWKPVVWLSHQTANGWLLQFVFGLPFCLAPAVSLSLSWWVVRRHAPNRVLWAMFGIAAQLPGQIFIINDSIFQQHLFWPVFLGLLVPLTMMQRIVLAVLAIFQFSHPIGMALLAGGSIAAALLAWGDPLHRRRYVLRCVLMALLAGAAIVKLRLHPDPYAAEECSLYMAWLRWQNGVMGWPLCGLACLWAAGAVLARRGATAGRPRLPGLVAVALTILAAACWAWWAATPGRWMGAIDYRRWVVPLSGPFYLMALYETWRGMKSSPAPDECLGRGVVAIVLAGAFAGVLGMQSFQWKSLLDRLMDDVRRHPHPVVPSSAVPWVRGTPLEHWGIYAQIMYMQGQAPRKLMLDEPCLKEALADRPRVSISPVHPIPPEPGPTGWYDCRPFLRELRERAASP